MPTNATMRHILYSVIFISLMLASCGSQEEVSRVLSPDGHVEAVLIETDGGATTSFGYRVLVETKGQWFSGEQVAWLYGAGRNEDAYGVNLKWNSDSELFIEYLDAREAKLMKRNINVAGRGVTVALHGGITDPTAPAGGMLHNLKKKGGG